jgi:hypothetical protein
MLCLKTPGLQLPLCDCNVCCRWGTSQTLGVVKVFQISVTFNARTKPNIPRNINTKLQPAQVIPWLWIREHLSDLNVNITLITGVGFLLTLTLSLTHNYLTLNLVINLIVSHTASSSISNKQIVTVSWIMLSRTSLDPWTLWMVC